MEQSGSLGTIAGIAAIRQWSLNDGYSLITKVHSGTGFGTDRSRGVYDATGSASGFGLLPTALIPGSVSSLSLYKGPNAAGNAALGEILSGNFYVESATMNFNFETNESVNWTANIAAAGVISQSAGPRPAGVAEIPYSPCAGNISIENKGGGGEVVIPHIKSAALTITRPATTSVNSGTIAGAGKCTTIRRKSGAADWTLALVSDDGNENSNIVPGDYNIIKINLAILPTPVFILLKWGIWGARTGLTVNPETGAFISQTYNASMKQMHGSEVGAFELPGSINLIV